MTNFREQHGAALAAAGALIWFQIATTLKQGGQLTAYQMSGVTNITPILDFFVGYGWLFELKKNGLPYKLTDRGPKYYNLTIAGREASNA